MFCGTQQPNCTGWRLNSSGTASPLYEADPDIAGPGVIGASIATAILSVVLTFIHTTLMSWPLEESCTM